MLRFAHCIRDCLFSVLSLPASASYKPFNLLKCSDKGRGIRRMIQAGEPVEDRAVDRVFVAFEGGGAKGLVHIGALKALEEYGANICGLAGTSAGAIIAALRATGMHADDMADPIRDTTLLPSLGPKFQTATDIFGRGGWARIAALRSATI